MPLRSNVSFEGMQSAHLRARDYRPTPHSAADNISNTLRTPGVFPTSADAQKRAKTGDRAAFAVDVRAARPRRPEAALRQPVAALRQPVAALRRPVAALRRPAAAPPCGADHNVMVILGNARLCGRRPNCNLLRRVAVRASKHERRRSRTPASRPAAVSARTGAGAYETSHAPIQAPLRLHAERAHARLRAL